jgi:hypothetical protein
MALKNINEVSGEGGSFKKATEIPVGESITGYVVGFEQSRVYEDQTNIVMQGEDGAQFTLATAGTLKYAIQDKKIRLGLYTEITNRGQQQKTNKAGKKFTQFVFDVAQDDERTAPHFSGAASSAQPTSEAVKGRFKSLANSATKG